MKLSINIDHVATLRNARGGLEPDPIEAARIAEDAGADGIVCHLREDRRHIRDTDVERLRKTITTKLDLEMAATKEIIEIAKRIKPDLATLVPERRQELTTEGGLDVVRLKNSLIRAVNQLQENGIPVSLFINPIRKQIKAAKEIGASMIEINTGKYSEARSSKRQQKLLKMIRDSVLYGKDLGLIVNAGHGLNYNNIVSIAAIKEIDEVSIGHAVISRAVFVGLDKAVREMAWLVKRD